MKAEWRCFIIDNGEQFATEAQRPAVSGQRSADKIAAYFFALEEIVVNLRLVFCSV